MGHRPQQRLPRPIGLHETEAVVRPSIVAIAIGLLVACGGCGALPTSPGRSAGSETANLAPVLSIAIVPDTDTLDVGQTQEFSLVVEMGPGSPASGPLPQWSSSNPSILAIDNSGRATARGVGEASIRAVFRGKSTIRQLQVR